MICLVYDPEDDDYLVITVDNEGNYTNTHRSPYDYGWLSTSELQQLTYDTLNFVNEDDGGPIEIFCEKWSKDFPLMIIYDVKFPLITNHPELFI